MEAHPRYDRSEKSLLGCTSTHAVYQIFLHFTFANATSTITFFPRLELIATNLFKPLVHLVFCVP